MNPSKYESGDHSGCQPDAFDRDLDAALASYANINPRMGLEDRIMARIAAERKHNDVGFPWRWPVAAFVALSVVLAIAIDLNPSKPAQREIAGPVKQQLGVPPIVSPLTDVPRVKTANSARSTPHWQRVASLPKLEKFPSPQPLSDQEKVLADYVARFRDEAVLVARVNAEELIRERSHMAEGAGNTDSTEFDQDEITNR